MTTTAPRNRVQPLSPAAAQLLACVAHHRLMSSRQLHALRAPGRSRRWTLVLLGDLEQRGLLSHVLAAGARKLWHVTEHGAQLAAASGLLDERPHVLSDQEASGALQAHTLAVNDVGIAFATAARARADEFGPLAWRHEVAHPLRPRPRKVIADALLTYLLADGERLSLQYRLLELDRATHPVERLATKLSRYAQLHNTRDRDRQPTWRAWYPAFPGVLVALAGAAPDQLERRRRTVLALCAADPQLTRTPQVSILICLLRDLRAHGPFAAIFRRPRQVDAAVDWLGRAPDDQPARS